MPIALAKLAVVLSFALGLLAATHHFKAHRDGPGTLPPPTCPFKDCTLPK